ncbi:ATP-dependent helicase, partial [Actinoplanes sp. NPDC051633]
MRVLHGFLSRDGTLGVWAETDTASLPASGGSEISRRGDVPWHPFARAAEGDPRPPAILLLPSTATRPMPSPLLGVGVSRARPRLRAWQVPAVAVPFVTADMVSEEDERAAPSLLYLAEVCAFAADLVARGRVLPAVWPDGPRAHWRPVLTGPDVTRHAELLRRMPAACRAERAHPGALTGQPAAEVLRAALHRLVDGLVR